MTDNTATNNIDSNTPSTTTTNDELNLDQYLTTLSSLKQPHKPTINLLTLLAQENHDKYSNKIVDLIIQYIYRTPARNRLPALYVVDSICKNLKSNQYTYITLFQQHIYNIFVKTYQQCNDDNIIKSLIKLYDTWIKQNVFDNNIHKQIKQYIDNNPVSSTTAPTNSIVCY